MPYNLQPLEHPLHPARDQRGMAAIGILLSVIGLFAVTAAVMSSVRAPSASTVSTDRVKAAAIIEQGNVFTVGFDSAIRTGLAPDSITYDSDTATSLFNPSVSGIVKPMPPAGVFASTSYAWVYKHTGTGPKIQGKDIGVFNQLDYGITLPHLTQSVCAEINRQLFGTTTIPTDAQLATNFTAAADSLYFSSTSLSGWLSGCVQATPSNSYHYFHIILAK